MVQTCLKITLLLWNWRYYYSWKQGHIAGSIFLYHLYHENYVYLINFLAIVMVNGKVEILFEWLRLWIWNLALKNIYYYAVYYCSVIKSCLVLCDLPVPHYLQEIAQVHVHWVSDDTGLIMDLHSLFFKSKLAGLWF